MSVEQIVVGFLVIGVLLVAIVRSLRFTPRAPVMGGKIGDPDHEVIVEPAEEPVPRPAPVPTVEPAQPQPLVRP